MAQTLRNVVEDFLVNKTIVFVGDSINGLVYQAAVRAAGGGCVYARARYLALVSLMRVPYLRSLFVAQICELVRWGLDVFTHAQGPAGAALEAGLEPGLVARLHRYWRRVARCVAHIAPFHAQITPESLTRSPSHRIAG